MGRVERRMYRRRKKRARLFGACAAIVVIAAAGLILYRMTSGHMTAQRLPEQTPSPIAPAGEVSTGTREITLAAEQWYVIQTGVFSTKEAAMDKADDFTARGAPGTVVQDSAKWRVFIAAYGSEEEASAVRTRLGEMQRVETYLYTWICPELRLRLSGPVGQLDVVEAGLTLSLQMACRLRDAAILLDAGEWTISEALAEVEEMDAQLSLWIETAEKRFQKPRPALVNQLMAQKDGWTVREKTLQAAGGSATQLSAAMKKTAMEMYDEAVRFRVNME